MAFQDHGSFEFVQDRSQEPLGLYRGLFKRALDIAAVAVLAIPVTIVVLVLAAFVALDGKNPFYFQKRLGRQGRSFKMVKLRSMVANADAILADYLAANPTEAREWNEKQKLMNDPRITKVGHLIRKTSLDELPQLWNVLIGDMSLVGPRPIMVDQKKIYPSDAYYDLRPGITGPWQISSRNESSFVERADFDGDYLNDLSFASDVRIMFKTVGVVVNATGH
ncbi:sugar transferase [Cognatishimia sp. D5M38]|uniref:Sugar transferase n=1 Tax=Cognatishimia coralii TaxID=3083254 RepID=A0ABU8QDQ2_9RHOB